MKILNVNVKCDLRNNVPHSRENNAFVYEIFIKYDLTTNFLAVQGCSKGEMFAYLSNQYLDENIVNLKHVPKNIKRILEKLYDKCSGFKINDDLYDVVRNFLVKNLNGLEFEFSDDDKNASSLFIQ